MEASRDAGSIPAASINEQPLACQVSGCFRWVYEDSNLSSKPLLWDTILQLSHKQPLYHEDILEGVSETLGALAELSSVVESNSW